MQREEQGVCAKEKGKGHSSTDDKCSAPPRVGSWLPCSTSVIDASSSSKLLSSRPHQSRQAGDGYSSRWGGRHTPVGGWGTHQQGGC